jgi:hypothetical protein
MTHLARRGLLAVLIVAGACGKKGAPLAPLHLVPGPVADLTVRRVGSDVQLHFAIPSKNLNGPGPIEIDRLEVYAVTIAAGAPVPPNRDLLTSKYVIGTVPVKPPPVEDEPPPENAPPDPRPGPGEVATFVEHLTEEKLTPVKMAVRPAPRTPAAPTAGTNASTRPPSPRPAPAIPGAPPAVSPGSEVVAAEGGPATVPLATLPGTALRVPEPPLPPYPVRVYITRGMTKKGRAGQPSARVQVPIVPPPAVPTALTHAVTEKSIVLKWTALPGTVSYNIYDKPESTTPINPQPIAAAEYERAGVTFGTEQCFIVRSVERIAAVTIESDPSDPLCVTPRDTFAPAAPKGLSVVAATGTMNLSWDANTEADLQGYLVLRSEVPGGTLQPLTPAPIGATSYEDKTAKPGVRYAYAIAAVDKAAPPNTSAPSASVEETAR